MTDKLKGLWICLKGIRLDELYIKTPDFEDNYTRKMGRRWQITLEGISWDLGLGIPRGWSFIIYILIVELGSRTLKEQKKRQLLMMVGHTLSLIGDSIGAIGMLRCFFYGYIFIEWIAWQESW